MSGQTFLDGAVELRGGDCLDVVRAMADCSIDAVVTDPPYALVSIVKRFGAAGAKATKDGDVYSRSSAGFMGKAWDTGERAFATEFWQEIYRVLKPGGHVAAFSGSRTYHRLAVAIEDSGFEIRDQIMWLYGSGFPKSHNAGHGWGTALKPAHEPIVLARKGLVGTVAANVAAHGTGAINIDGCRVEGKSPSVERRESGKKSGKCGNDLHSNQRIKEGLSPYKKDVDLYSKPRLGELYGRWPANVIHDGGDDVLAAFPESSFGNGGSTAKLFYHAKADGDDRIGSKHPTVKPVDLMQWLCRLITPPGGLILDPFAGTGTTGEAAWREGFRAVLIEREAEYQADIARRMGLADAGHNTRKGAIAVARGDVQDAGPLFGAVS